ncbi:MAG TPA: terminase small subunit [Vicinamibacteria bacterium]|nr:terminase small subunit [Vicinamibacteria bacterium]
MKGLTPKQRLFVTEYTKDLNATAAARRAGYSKKTADRIGPELLGKTGVAGAIAVKTAAQLARAEITAQDVVNELACIARSKASWFVDERGNLIEPAKLSPEAAAALVGWDVVRRNITSGDGQTDEVIRIKRWNKVEALKLLAQRFGLLDERAQIEVVGPKLEILLSCAPACGDRAG